MPVLPDGEPEITPEVARLQFAHGPSVSTIKRWIRDGYGARGSSERVFLDGHREGRRYVTSREAIARFKRALKLRSQNG